MAQVQARTCALREGNRMTQALQYIQEYVWHLVPVLLALVTWSLRRRGLPWYRNAYSQRLVDLWTITHFFHGVVLFGLTRVLFNWIGLDWDAHELIGLAINLEIVWESFENRNYVLRWFRSHGETKYFGDSLGNSGFDVLACTLGALCTSLLI